MKVRVSGLAAWCLMTGMLAVFGCAGGSGEEGGGGGCGGAQQPQNQLTCGSGTRQQGNQCVPN